MIIIYSAAVWTDVAASMVAVLCAAIEGKERDASVTRLYSEGSSMLHDLRA